MAEQVSREEALTKLAELIKDMKFGMLTTVEDDGCLRSRPMASVNNDEFDGTIYFFTAASSPKVHEVEHDRHVNVAYADPGDQKYVSVSGLARLDRDPQRIKKFWNPLYKAYFPKGLDDPDLALLRVEVQKAEYWDSPSSPVVHLLGYVKAVATGQPYEGEASDHQKVRLDTPRR